VTDGRRARLRRALVWALFAVALALASLHVTWRALAAVDFGYPVFYDVLGLGATIDRYGPENDVRPGFHRTSRAERERIFAAIARAIRNGGAGLAELRYHARDGRVLGRVLTEAEVQHLRDVAALVTAFERVGWSAWVVLLVLTGAALGSRKWPPRPRYLAVGLLGALVIASAAVFALGPEAVFYWLHEQVFPPDHQWFFYYQESLMSMMMRAPDLFAAIAVVWLGGAALTGVGLFLAIDRGLRAWARGVPR